MTEGLRALLQHYGALVVTLSHLMSQRPGTEHESLDAYYKALGNPLPDEPVLVFRISKDSETRFLSEGQHDVQFEDDLGQQVGKVTVWELPEDEFWFFRAFRPGLFDLDRDLPSFMYAMGTVNAFAMFEGYLSDLLRDCFRKHPRLMGGQRKLDYEHIFEAPTKEDIIDIMIEREVRDLMYLPIPGLLKSMREQMGFRSLIKEYDEAVTQLSLVRNCLLHNQGKVDKKLSQCSGVHQLGDSIDCNIETLTLAVNNLRKFAYEIDKIFEGNGLTSASTTTQ